MEVGLSSLNYTGRGFDQPGLPWEGVGVAWITRGGF